ncbi:MAG: cobalt-precorrin-6A reductase [Ancalomicrobiaceae bacterium]|nr:cobalt-precorrin-6A reductase [Ancalomicrobiaceae bacterium]
MNLLILGGTTEASRLAERLAGHTKIAATLSYAGRTEAPARQPIPIRIGGFGGVDGLVAYLRDHAIDMVVDATHPFAAQMSEHAVAACALTGTALLVFSRAPWQRQEGDRWIEVADNAAAAAALGATPRRVLMTIGRLGLSAFLTAPQHHYLIRTIDPPDDADVPPDHRLLYARGPFTLADELRLMREEAVDIVVTKNSGGAATYAKIAAARDLALPVVIVQPPARADVPTCHDLDACMAVIEAHVSAP